MKIKNRHLFIGAAVFFVSLLFFLPFSGRSEYQKALKELRADGFPITVKEFNEWNALPKGEENAADFLMPLLSGLSLEGADVSTPILGRGILPQPGVALSDPTMNAFVSVINSNMKTYDALVAHPDFDSCRFPLDIDPEEPTSYSWAYQAESRELSNHLLVYGLYLAEVGEIDAAIRCVETILWVGRMLGQDPTYGGYISGSMVNRNGARLTGLLLERYSLSIVQLESLQKMFTEYEAYIDISRVVRGSFIFVKDIPLHPPGLFGRYPNDGGDHGIKDGMILYLNSEESKATGSGARSAYQAAYLMGKQRFRNQLFVIEHLRAQYEISQAPYFTSVPLESLQHEAPDEKICSRWLFWNLTENFHLLHMKYSNILRFRFVRTAIEIERYHQSKGSVPESLAILEEFTGRPLPRNTHDVGFLSYRAEPKGYVVYQKDSRTFDRISDRPEGYDFENDQNVSGAWAFAVRFRTSVETVVNGKEE